MWLPCAAAILHCSETFLLAFIVTSCPFHLQFYLEYFLPMHSSPQSFHAVCEGTYVLKNEYHLPGSRYRVMVCSVLLFYSFVELITPARELMFWFSSSERPYFKWERDNTTTVNIYFNEFVEQDDLKSRGSLPGMHYTLY